jgi:hypothetical protein
MTSELEKAFDNAMFDLYRRAKAEAGHDSKPFLRMLNKYRGLLLAALDKVETLHRYLPQEHLVDIDAALRAARGTTSRCERRERVIGLIDTTTVALCNGDHTTASDIWPRDSLWISFEMWAFGEPLPPEELEALCALPAADRVAGLLIEGNATVHAARGRSSWRAAKGGGARSLPDR